ncbi:MAG TPA: ATP-binding protein [Prolixibacteraceae bacterium]
MNNNSFDKILLVDNQIDELTRVASWLEELGEEWELPMSLVFSLNLALEEALTNTIMYGYGDECQHSIEIHFSKSGQELKISIIDDGLAYNPTTKPDPDITLSVEDRPIGGLGIFLIKKIMDTVEYQRIENKNHLMLTKNIKS